MKLWSMGLVIALIAAAAGDASAATKLAPAQLTDELHAQPDAVLHFIIRGDPPGVAAAQKLAAFKMDADKPKDLPFINGVFLLLKESDAESVAQRPDISQVYYLRAELADTYLHIIQALAYASAKVPTPGIVNMSLGPDASIMPVESEADEPINAATRKLADQGLVIVMAVGNYYDPNNPNPGVTNPWCRVDWVICVGAASSDATTLYENSARGSAKDSTTWPDLVANGIDVMSTWPEKLAKSPIQISQDHQSAAWRALPADQQQGWAVMSGTSQATAQVSRAAAQVIYFFRHALLATKNAKRDTAIFSLEIPRQRFNSVSRRGRRLTGDVSHPSEGVVEVTYKPDDPWKVAKQILMDTAVPMPKFRPEDVGAGFVSPDYIDAQFGRFQVGEPTVLPLKVIP
jgi:Subtilase family